MITNAPRRHAKVADAFLAAGRVERLNASGGR
jgi:hypothetical protein